MKKAIVSATLMLAVYVSYGSSYVGYPYYSNSDYRYYTNDYYYPQQINYAPRYYQQPRAYYPPQYSRGGYYSSNNNSYSSAPRRSYVYPDPNQNSRNGQGGIAGVLTDAVGPRGIAGWAADIFR